MYILSPIFNTLHRHWILFHFDFDFTPLVLLRLVWFGFTSSGIWGGIPRGIYLHLYVSPLCSSGKSYITHFGSLLFILFIMRIVLYSIQFTEWGWKEKVKNQEGRRKRIQNLPESRIHSRVKAGAEAGAGAKYQILHGFGCWVLVVECRVDVNSYFLPRHNSSFYTVYSLESRV